MIWYGGPLKKGFFVCVSFQNKIDYNKVILGLEGEFKNISALMQSPKVAMCFIQNSFNGFYSCSTHPNLHHVL